MTETFNNLFCLSTSVTEYLLTILKNIVEENSLESESKE